MNKGLSMISTPMCALVLIGVMRASAQNPVEQEGKKAIDLDIPKTGKPSKPKMPSIKAGGSAVMEKALSIPNGSPVAVKTSNGSTLRGTLLSMTGQALTMQMLQGNRFVTQAIPFAEIASVKKKGGAPKASMPAMSTPGVPLAPGVGASLASLPEGAPVIATLAD